MWRDHVLSQIRHAEVSAFPFPYFYIRDIFPVGFYRQLISSEARFDPKPTYSGRHTRVCRAPGDQWAEVSGFVNSDKFRDALCEKVGIDCQGFSLHFVHEDLSGFHIRPHTDVEAKLITYLFYLPNDASHAHLGTWFLKPKAPLEWSEDHKDWNLFDKVAIAPYLPNSMIFWRVTHDSYHAVDIEFAKGDPLQSRLTLRGFVFDESKPLPYAFREEYGDVAMPDLPA